MDYATAWSNSASSRARKRAFVALLTLLLAAAVAAATLPALGRATATPQSPATDTPRSSAASNPTTAPRAKAADPISRLTALGLPIFCGAGTRPLVALTFDDGPGMLTPEALRTLRAHHAAATFFLVGKLVAQRWLRPELDREVRYPDVAFGDHTWDHVDVTGASRSFLDRQIARTRSAIQRVTHRPVTLFRPPLGAHDANLELYMRAQGMLMILWSIDSEDSQGATADQIFHNVRNHLSPGDIVLLHDNRGTTERALPRILDLIDRLGYRTVTVPQLLRLDPPSNEQVRQRTCS